MIIRFEMLQQFFIDVRRETYDVIDYASGVVYLLSVRLFSTLVQQRAQGASPPVGHPRNSEGPPVKKKQELRGPDTQSVTQISIRSLGCFLNSSHLQQLPHTERSIGPPGFFSSDLAQFSLRNQKMICR